MNLNELQNFIILLMVLTTVIFATLFYLNSLTGNTFLSERAKLFCEKNPYSEGCTSIPEPIENETKTITN